MLACVDKAGYSCSTCVMHGVKHVPYYEKTFSVVPLSFLVSGEHSFYCGGFLYKWLRKLCLYAIRCISSVFPKASGVTR